MLTKEFMTIGVNLRDQRRLTLVIESAYHLCCGDFQDFLQSISSDGISRNRGGAEGEIWLESGSGQQCFHILKFLHCSLATASAILTGEAGPSAATMSRARYRLDAFMMLLRQQQWANWQGQAVLSIGCLAFSFQRQGA